MYNAVKRSLDLIVATTVLLVLSPLMAVAAIAIRVQMGSPVFFRQVRPGYKASLIGPHSTFIPMTLNLLRKASSTQCEAWRKARASAAV
jgi:lipopolysaccharide/colanic/teichoic acid biosynthesis glycosyltransferase